MSEPNGKRSAWQRKKYVMTWAVFIVGTGIAVRTNADLHSWALFGTFLLGTFAVADVTDKKLNGAA
jgi:hypothetical protein